MCRKSCDQDMWSCDHNTIIIHAYVLLVTKQRTLKDCSRLTLPGASIRVSFTSGNGGTCEGRDVERWRGKMRQSENIMVQSGKLTLFSGKS